MRTILTLFILTTLYSCESKQYPPRHSDIFRYFDKKSNDTIKFYRYRDFDSALTHAKNEDKNILVIFSCWACMDTPGKEWKTLSLYSDVDKLYDNFVIAWLPIDDNRLLKDSLPVNVFGPGCFVKTIGEKNFAFQLDKTETSTQPTLCFIDKTGKAFGQKIGYTPDEEDVEAFIKSGMTK